MWLNPPDSSLVIDTVTGWRPRCATASRTSCRSVQHQLIRDQLERVPRQGALLREPVLGHRPGQVPVSEHAALELVADGVAVVQWAWSASPLTEVRPRRRASQPGRCRAGQGRAPRTVMTSDSMSSPVAGCACRLAVRGGLATGMREVCIKADRDQPLAGLSGSRMIRGQQGKDHPAGCHGGGPAAGSRLTVRLMLSVRR